METMLQDYEARVPFFERELGYVQQDTVEDTTRHTSGPYQILFDSTRQTNDIDNHRVGRDVSPVAQHGSKSVQFEVVCNDVISHQFEAAPRRVQYAATPSQHGMYEPMASQMDGDVVSDVGSFPIVVQMARELLLPDGWSLDLMVADDDWER